MTRTENHEKQQKIRSTWFEHYVGNVSERNCFPSKGKQLAHAKLDEEKQARHYGPGARSQYLARAKCSSSVGIGVALEFLTFVRLLHTQHCKSSHPISTIAQIKLGVDAQ